METLQSTEFFDTTKSFQHRDDFDAESLWLLTDSPSLSLRKKEDRLFNRIYPSGFKTELKLLLQVALPVTFQAFFGILVIPIGLLFAGRLGVTELAALALGNSVIAVFVNSVYLGLGSASDCFISQAFGSNNLQLVGILFQRFAAIFGLVSLVLLGILLNIENLLLLIGQEPEICKLTAQFITICLAGFGFLCLQRLLTSFFISQRVLLPTTCAAFLGGLAAIVGNLLFVELFGLALTGSALVQIIVYLVPAVFLTLYLLRSDLADKTLSGGLSWRLFEDWGTAFSMAINGMLTVCLELWAFEIALLLSGLLGETELAAQSIVFNLDLVFYAIPISFNLATGVRVGSALGEGNADKAWTIGNVSITVMLMSSVVTTTILASLRFELPKIFTDDPAVIELASELIPYIAFYNAFFNVCCAVKGTLRGAGKLRQSAGVIFVGYYLLSFPISVPLMFTTELRSKALWLGFCIALIFNCVAFIVYVFKYLDFDQLCIEAKARVANRYTTTKENQNSYDIESPMPKELKIKRGLTVICFFSVAALGLIIKLVLPVQSASDQDVFWPDSNTTLGA